MYRTYVGNCYLLFVLVNVVTGKPIPSRRHEKEKKRRKKKEFEYKKEKFESKKERNKGCSFQQFHVFWESARFLSNIRTVGLWLGMLSVQITDHQVQVYDSHLNCRDFCGPCDLSPVTKHLVWAPLMCPRVLIPITHVLFHNRRDLCRTCLPTWHCLLWKTPPPSWSPPVCFVAQRPLHGNWGWAKFPQRKVLERGFKFELFICKFVKVGQVFELIKYACPDPRFDTHSTYSL